MQIRKEIIGGMIYISENVSRLSSIEIIIKVDQIIKFIISEYLTEEYISDLLFERLRKAFFAPIQSATKNENISPRIAFPYVVIIIRVAKPSPENITGIEKAKKIVKSPTGAPMQ